ncbi:hypothetical protein PS838_05606 [Pseudomonas fluorescens]|nr:hypothetical protein PS838_05606 [Pseudomonas fluorescens]
MLQKKIEEKLQQKRSLPLTAFYRKGLSAYMLH